MSEVTATTGPKFPEAIAQLTGNDGNAFAVFGAVTDALKKAGATKDERDEFLNEAMSGDYNNVLQTAMRWVTVR